MSEPDRVDFAFLPADVDQDSTVGPFDLLAHRQMNNGEMAPPPSGIGDFIDTNRNGMYGGIADPFDLLRIRQLVNGASPSTRVWNTESMNSPQP